jgi:hypothetical protein
MGREEVKRFTTTLLQRQAEDAELHAAITANLKEFGYGG